MSSSDELYSTSLYEAELAYVSVQMRVEGDVPPFGAPPNNKGAIILTYEELEAILKSPSVSYKFARNLLKGRFLEGEEAISKDSLYKDLYESFIKENTNDMRHDQSFEHLLSRTIDDCASQYGSVHENFSDIAQRWSKILDKEVTPYTVGLLMLELKLSRLSRNPDHADTLLDIAGYAKCIYLLKEDLENCGLPPYMVDLP